MKVTMQIVPISDDISQSTVMQFRIGTAFLDGISSMDGTAKLPPNASFIARWNVKSVKNMRLIYEAEYQVCCSIIY